MTNSTVYYGIDWNNDALMSLVKALASTIVTLLFFLMVLVANRVKFYMNGVSRKVSKASFAYKL